MDETWSHFISRWISACAAVAVFSSSPVFSADGINGRVLGAGTPIAGAKVSLWVASSSTPKQLAQARTGADGRFVVKSNATDKNAIVYLVAQGGHAASDRSSGDNPNIALIAVLGSRAPHKVIINEMTTVASVWTHAQFLEGRAIKGHALGLKI